MANGDRELVAAVRLDRRAVERSHIFTNIELDDMLIIDRALGRWLED